MVNKHHFLHAQTDTLLEVKYIEGYPHLWATFHAGNGWACTRGNTSIIKLSQDDAIAQLGDWYADDLSAQAKGETSDVWLWRTSEFWIETHPIPDSPKMYAERDMVAGNWYCSFGQLTDTRPVQSKAAALLREWYTEAIANIPPTKGDNSIYVRNTDRYLEVLAIAPAPRMSAELDDGQGKDTPVWVCRRGEEVLTRNSKFDAETLLFTWYCEARLRYDIFEVFTGNYIGVALLEGVPPMYANMLTDGTWEVRVGDTTVVNRPHRESAIDMLRMAYDGEIAAAKAQEDNQALTQRPDNEFEGQPLTLTIEVEATLRTAKFRSFWQPIAEMHNDDEQVGAVGLRQDGNILVWLKSEAVGEFEYNIGVGQLPHLLEEAVQAHREDESSGGFDIVTDIKHTLGLEIALGDSEDELVTFCRDLLGKIDVWQQTSIKHLTQPNKD